jgi:hypothetical protein
MKGSPKGQSGIRIGLVLDIVAETPKVAIDAAIIVSNLVGNNTRDDPQKD